MPRIIITGVPPYDGAYPIDLNFTNRELHTIKQVSGGVRPREIIDAINAGDTGVGVALAANALRRAGQVVNIDMLWEAEAAKFVLDFNDEADDAGPPPQETSGSANETSAPPPSSGTSSSTTGAPEENDPSPTGTPA